MEKFVFVANKIILYSERHAEHPFAGRNTQQICLREEYFSIINFNDSEFIISVVLNLLEFQSRHKIFLSFGPVT